MLGLGLKTSNRTTFDSKGYFMDTNAYWTHDIAGSSTSLDDLENLTVIINCSYASTVAISSGYNFPVILHALADLTNDTGFEISCSNLSKRSTSYGAGSTNMVLGASDGSGAITENSSVANRVGRFGYNRGGDVNKAEGHPSFAFVARFKSGATNEMNNIIISNYNIELKEGNNDVANLGEISGKTNIQIGNNNNFGSFNKTAYTQGTVIIHKIAIWNTALTDTEIMKLTGFNHTSIADTDRADLDGFYHDAVRFRNYSDLSIDSPEHLWDFSKKTPGVYSSGTTSDTGNVADLDMTATGNPVIGSRGQV